MPMPTRQQLANNNNNKSSSPSEADPNNSNLAQQISELTNVIREMAATNSGLREAITGLTLKFESSEKQQQQQQQRISELESRLQAVENKTPTNTNNTRVNTTAASLADCQIESGERVSKLNNMVVVNCPEPSKVATNKNEDAASDPLQNDDLSAIRSAAVELELDPSTIICCFRMSGGNGLNNQRSQDSASTRARPLKVITNSNWTKRGLMSFKGRSTLFGFLAGDSRSAPEQSIYIRHDCTYSQREMTRLAGRLAHHLNNKCQSNDYVRRHFKSIHDPAVYKRSKDGARTNFDFFCNASDKSVWAEYNFDPTTLNNKSKKRNGRDK